VSFDQQVHGSVMCVGDNTNKGMKKFDIGVVPVDAALKIRLQGWNIETFDVEIDE
jgi:hypothetical protein